MPLLWNYYIPLCTKFATRTTTSVFKLSKWNLVHMIPMKCRCARHIFHEARPMGSRVMPLLWNSYIPLCTKFATKTSSSVFKLSEWNLVHMIPMKCTCARHIFHEARPRGCLPLLWNSYIPGCTWSLRLKYLSCVFSIHYYKFQLSWTIFYTL